MNFRSNSRPLRKANRLYFWINFTMIAASLYSFHVGWKRQFTVFATRSDGTLLRTFTTRQQSTIHRRVQVQIVHRHGDRTPITPLKDEDYWAKQLIAETTLAKISSNTELILADQANTHNAGGRGPFGKLTELGLLQLVELGTSLREQFSGENLPRTDEKGRTLHPHIWHPERPLTPTNIRVMSTNFLRTIQSVQGLLVGLFPDGTEDKIPIDVRHTNWMIPDPQPRRTLEQAALEKALAVRPHIATQERALRPLALRSTKALHDMLAPDARDADFGVPQNKEHPSEMSIEIQPLSWNQLAEISKCFAVRNLLPAGISKEDVEAISQHAAWRWFEAFRHPRLAHLAMGTMMGKMVKYMQNYSQEPPMTVWSAHDSTLICLMCAFKLEQPAVWPDYGSYLMLELIEVNENNNTEQLYVRFSLNGQVLKSQWEDEPVEMLPLTSLVEKIRSQGAIKESS